MDSLFNLTSDNHTKSLPSFPLYVRGPAAVILFLATAVTSIGNLATLIVLYRTPQLRTLSSLLIANFTVVDFLYSILSEPLTVVSVIAGRWLLSEGMCNFKAFMTNTATIVSFNTLALLSIERYVAVVKPLHYQTIVTTIRVAIPLVVIWLGVLVASSVGLLLGTYHYNWKSLTCTVDWTKVPPFTIAVFTIFCVHPPIIMHITYHQIFKVARRHARAIKQQPVVQLTQTGETREIKSETKAAFTILIIIGLYLVSWSPYILSQLYGLVSGNELQPYVELFTSWMTLINSASNTFIYNWRNKSFREGYRKLARSIVGLCKRDV